MWMTGISVDLILTRVNVYPLTYAYQLNCYRSRQCHKTTIKTLHTVFA